MRLKGLKPWLKLVKNPVEVGEAVRSAFCISYPTLVALAVSVAKWHPSKGRKRGIGLCGLCVLRNCIGTNSLTCKLCPLAEVGEHCLKKGSLWQNYLWAENPKEEEKYARQMYALLVDLYVKEYKKPL